MAAEPVFIDTNVLIYAGRIRAPQHEAARGAVRRLQEEGRPLWISAQVLREYLAVVTRPQPGSPALVMADALADVRRFAVLFNVTGEGGSVMDRLLQLLAVHAIAGKQVHDAHLVATMLEAGIRDLLTFNQSDFMRFEPLIRVTPP